MEICQADYGIIKKDLDDLRELLVRTKTKAENNCCFNSIYALNLLCDALNGDKFSNYLSVVKDNRAKYFESLLFTKRHKEMFINTFLNNKKLIAKLSDEYANLYRKYIFENKLYDNYSDIIFSKEDARLILYDFFERYHPNDLEYVDQLICNKRILQVSSIDLFDGIWFNIYNKQPIILVKGNNYSIKSLVSIIHELGHAVDFRNISKNYSVNVSEKYYYCSNYLEFLPRLYEKQALEYFYHFHFDDSYVLTLLQDYYFTTYYDWLQTYIFSLLPNHIIEKNKYLKVNKDYIKLLIPVEKRSLSLDDCIDYSDLDLKTSFTYGLSGLLATVCDSKIKDNSGDAKNLYENIMANRLGLFKPDIFRDLNLTDDDIEKCLRKEINFLAK